MSIVANRCRTRFDSRESDSRLPITLGGDGCLVTSMGELMGLRLALAERDVEEPHLFFAWSGLILEEAEQGGPLYRGGSGFMAVEVPEQRLAGGAGLGVFLGAPKGPERGIIALDAFAGGQERFEEGQDLEAGVAIEIALAREKWQEIGPPPAGARFGVLLDSV